MAKTLIMTDDIDGSADAETVEFSVNGTSYEIDLARRNRAAFDKALKPYVDAARKTSGRGRGGPRRGRRRGSSRNELADIRGWASENGYAVAPRGRIAAEVVEAYNAAR